MLLNYLHQNPKILPDSKKWRGEPSAHIIIVIGKSKVAFSSMLLTKYLTLKQDDIKIVSESIGFEKTFDKMKKDKYGDWIPS